jgi:hypothetical protein
VVAVDGDFRLGGDDFDAILVEHLLDRLQRQVKTDLGVIRSLLRGGKEMGSPPDMLLARQRLKEAAERAKIELSESDAAQVTIPDILGTSLDAEIKLSEYNRLISPLVDRTLTKMRDVLKAAKCGSADIDRVILVGGSTRNRLVRERVANAVKEPWVSDRVDEVVAQGAAIVASHLSAPDVDMTPEEVSTPIEIQNVTPFSLGVCAKAAKGQMQYINSIILQKNSPVPSMQARQYELQTGPNRDNELDVFMLQGEDHDPAQCLAVGKYIFSDVRHSPGGVTPVSIEYGYDRSGIITAKAWETQTRRSLPLRVQPLPEDLSWLHELQQRGRFDPSSLQLVVSQPGYDDVAALLRSLHLPFQEYVRGQPLSCDILFLNCLASDYPEVTQLSQYVADGGCLYASCCVAGHLGETFSEAIQFHPSGCRSEKIRADVVDPELAAVLGKHLSIEYDSAACYTITRLGVGGQVLLRESKTQEEVMVMAPYGKGYIFYTCFHHHKNISQPEKQLLQLLVMKQISAVSGIPIEAISQTVRHH